MVASSFFRFHCRRESVRTFRGFCARSPPTHGEPCCKTCQNAYLYCDMPTARGPNVSLNQLLYVNLGQVDGNYRNHHCTKDRPRACNGNSHLRITPGAPPKPGQSPSDLTHSPTPTHSSASSMTSPKVGPPRPPALLQISCCLLHFFVRAQPPPGPPFTSRTIPLPPSNSPPPRETPVSLLLMLAPSPSG
jgi:hypothetical protein